MCQYSDSANATTSRPNERVYQWSEEDAVVSGKCFSISLDQQQSFIGMKSIAMKLFKAIDNNKINQMNTMDSAISQENIELL